MTRRILPLLVTLLLLASCGEAEVAQKEEDIVATQQSWYAKYQPVPFFTWSLPRHLLTELYSKQNEAVATYTYVQSEYTGKILWSCPSIGFPIPMGTQLTNPMQKIYEVALPMAEPNGTFSPAVGSGTWVMCVGEGGKVWPRYEEKLVTTSAVPLVELDGQLVPSDGVKPAFEIDPSRPANIPSAPNSK